MELGAPIKSEFMLDQSVTFVNHGSYGCTPKSVMQHRFRLMEEQEAQPDKFFRFSLENYYEKALQSAADFLGANPENLALVENVTTGINTIVKNLSFRAGDKILVNSHAYEAVKKIIQEQADFRGVEVVPVKVVIPIKSEDEFVGRFREAFSKHKDIKLAVFDHISSPSAIVFPIQKLIEVAKEFGAMTLIDGAHAPGHVELNIEKLGVDFYSGSFHKWCFVPRSCGFLWFSPKFNGKIRPLVTSHGYGHSLNEQFSMPGTRDTTNMLSLPKGLEFYKRVGGLSAIQKHAKEMFDFAAEIFGQIAMKKIDVPETMRSPLMMALSVPIKEEASMEKSWKITKDIFEYSNVQIGAAAFDGIYYIRLSCHVYNTRQDYIDAKEGIAKYLRQYWGLDL